MPSRQTRAAALGQKVFPFDANHPAMQRLKACIAEFLDNPQPQRSMYAPTGHDPQHMPSLPVRRRRMMMRALTHHD